VILLCGISDDAPMARVRDLLAQRSIDHLFYDQRHVAGAEIELRIANWGRGIIRIGDREVDLATITAVYARNHDVRKLPSIEQGGPDCPEWHHAVRFEERLLTWLDMCGALIVNRPSAMAANGSKPYQSEQIRKLGFDVPRTLLTTDCESALDFWRQHGQVIYKSISSQRSIVSRLRPEHLGRITHLSACPTQFQEFIDGQDYRVHVVGDDVYACTIESSADDYRYDSSATGPNVYPCDPGSGLIEQCRNLARCLELPLAGIDLRLTSAGKWYCFEVNPSPAFTYYEQATGQPLGDAVVRLLLSGSGARQEQTLSDQME
jgi:hypothetical protein